MVSTTLGINADFWEDDNACGLPFALVGVVAHFTTTTTAATFIKLVTQVFAVTPPVDSAAIILANTLEDALWLGPL